MNKLLRHIILLAVISFNAVHAFSQSAMPDTVCVGTTKRYYVNDAAVPAAYTWKVNGVAQASTKNEISITWNTAGTFTITVQERNATGCDGDVRSLSVYVFQPNSIRYPAINATANTNTLLQARVFSTGDSYLWSPSFGLNNSTLFNPVFNFNQTIEYKISVTNVNGCTVVDTLLVKVFPASQPSAQYSGVFIPDAFSPNGDGYNDKLTPLFYKISQLKYFRVFNRWGQLLFETRTAGEGWDGSYKGVSQPADVYTWTIEATGTDARNHSKRGTTILIR